MYCRIGHIPLSEYTNKNASFPPLRYNAYVKKAQFHSPQSTNQFSSPETTELKADVVADNNHNNNNINNNDGGACYSMEEVHTSLTMVPFVIKSSL